MAALERQLGLTTFGKLWAWVQTHSMWPDLFGTSCCTIEMMAVVGARCDIARFGMEFFRASPRQADLMIVPGRISHKMARPLRQIYDQMLERKWVIAMGACACSGGMFNNFATVQGVDRSGSPSSTVRAATWCDPGSNASLRTRFRGPGSRSR